MIPVRNLLGIGSIPFDRSSASKWLVRKQVPTCMRSGRGGDTEYVHLHDLPEQVQRAYLERVAEDAGLDTGTYDDAAHIELLKRPFKAQSKAHESALKLMFITKRERVGLTWDQIEEAGKAEFKDFPTRNTWKSWKRKTKGVDPANWAPALVPDWKGSGTGHAVSEEAMERLVELMMLTGKNGRGYTLKGAYLEVKSEAKEKGWNWPALHTVRRRWNAMDPITRIVATKGEERAVAQLRMTQFQHTVGLHAMDCVDIDGREFKVFVRWPDGSIGCPWVVALVDRASHKVVGYAVGRSENADVTEEAIIHACKTHFRPLSNSSDQGSGLVNKRIWGGQTPYFRKKQTKTADWEVPGVLSILGIEGKNKGIAAKTSNLQENVWSHLSKIDNHPAFYRAQRPGPNDPENARPDAVSLEVFKGVLKEAVEALNSDNDTRVRGLQKGESREQAFERLLKPGPKRTITPFMRRRLGMIWVKKTVRPDGRIHFDRGLFGDHTTQATMLEFQGKKVLVGFNPADFGAPAMVCGWEDNEKRGRLLVEALPAFKKRHMAAPKGGGTQLPKSAVSTI